MLSLVLCLPYGWHSRCEMMDMRMFPSSLSSSLVSSALPSGLSPFGPPVPLASDWRLDLLESERDSMLPDKRPMVERRGDLLLMWVVMIDDRRREPREMS